MAQKKIILEEIEALNSLKNLAESYEEIAVIRMQNIKDKVLKTRNFLTKISDVYVDLKASYTREVKDLISRRKKGDKTILPALQKSKNTLYVYLSSNGKLYGSVTQKTFKLFIQDLKKNAGNDIDILIIGSAGRDMFTNSGYIKPFDYFEMPDTKIEMQHISQLMEKFLKYQKVYIYYGKFGNVVTQSAIATSITGEDIFETETPIQVSREDRFIFEPTLEKIFHFFETQLMSNLFSQGVLENQLARHASRVNAMEEALIHIEEESKKLNRQTVRIKHLLQNKKQLETISGIALWM